MVFVGGDPVASSSALSPLAGERESKLALSVAAARGRFVSGDAVALEGSGAGLLVFEFAEVASEVCDLVVCFAACVAVSAIDGGEDSANGIRGGVAAIAAAVRGSRKLAAD